MHLRFAAVLAAPLLAAPVMAQVTPTYPNLTYAVVGGRDLKLDLYLPASGAPPLPCVVHIHGGGWQSGSRTQFPGYASRLLAAGIAVASVDYRLTSEAGLYGTESVLYPAQIHDVKGAVRWLRAHAATYGIDPNRMASWGTSAGAHLSALLGVSAGMPELEGTTGGNVDEPSSVLAFVDYFGPTDLLSMQDMVTTPPGSAFNHDDPGSPESKLLGWSGAGQGLRDIKVHRTDPTPPYPDLVHLASLASPLQHVSVDAAPGFIGHGTNDTTVPIGQSAALAAELAAASVFVDYRAVSGAGHGFLGVAIDSAAVLFMRRVLFSGSPVSVFDRPAETALVAAPNPTRGSVRLTHTGALGATAIEIRDVGGRCVKRGTARGETWVWDGTDDRGRRVPVGVYWARLTSQAVPAIRITLVR